MHTGSDIGGAAFSTRRPNAPNLATFDLPPPPLGSSQKYQYAVNGTQSNQAPGSLASVGNLLTPPSTIGGNEVSPSPSASVSNSVSSAPAYANGGYTSWSPSQQTHPSYYGQHNQPQQYQHSQRVPYSPANTIVRGNPHSPPSSEGGQIPQPYDLPSFTTAAPMTPATLPSMGAQPQGQQQMQGQMMGSSTPVSNAPQPSPVNTQEAFRPPPTPTYYQQQSAPHSPFPYTTGPPPNQITPLSAGPMSGRPQMSPASA